MREAGGPVYRIRGLTKVAQGVSTHQPQGQHKGGPGGLKGGPQGK